MAQYYQIVGQPTMSLEDLRQFYPNLTCIESSGGVQYVINNSEEGSNQFEPQQVLLSTDQQILLNSSETQQIIIDQSQIQYTQQPQQYSVQENEIVADYQQNEVVVNNQQQQIYYASPKQHIIQQSPQAPILAQQLTQPQIPSQQIMNNTQRVVVQHSTPTPIRHVVPQPQAQINNAHLMAQRRIPVAQNQQTVTPPRSVTQQPNVGVRLQYALQEQQQDQNQQLQMNQDDNQMVLNEGRVMTLGQFKQELAQNQQENHQTVITNQSVSQNCAEKQSYKPPAPKRNYKRTNNGRGALAGGVSPSIGRGRGRGANQQSPKPFQQVQQVTSQPQTPPQQPQQQQKPMVPYAAVKPQARVPAIQQQPPRGPIMQHPNIQHRQIQQQQPQNIIQQQQPFQQQNNRVQPLIPLSPLVHNGHVPPPPLPQQQQQQQQQQQPPQTQQQSPGYSPPNSQGQQPYLDDSSSSMSDEYRDSARMLVCLENGEQRLITFTLPKESCTVQDLLEQVGVPFKSDTKIECISNPGSDIDYIVYVGAVNNSPFPIDAQQVLTVDSLGDTQECIVSQSGAVIPVSEPPKPPQPPPAVPVPPPEPPAEPELTPEPPKLLPRFVPGCLAVCNHCGYLSEDFNRCQRCKTRLPEDVKSISLNKEKAAAENDKKAAKNTPSPKLTPPPKTTVVTTPIVPNTKPPAKNTRGKNKKAAQEIEPVVLTLSSDEEDNVTKTPTGNHALNRMIDNAVTLSAIQKEPVIPTDCNIDIEKEFLEGIYGGGKDEELKANIPLISTTLSCRTVRIGSYRFVPRDEISLSTLGMRISVPLVSDPTETYKLIIPMKYIIKVLGNFSKALPVLFFYVTPSIGAMIRKYLKMKEGSEYYFDPLSKEDPFKRITLLPDFVCEDTKAKIKELYLTTPYKMLEELTPKEANDILIRTCPREGSFQKPPIGGPVSFSDMRQLVIYPPGKGGIAINAEDYLCLAQDQFLNDVIIDFYLKYLATHVLAASMQQKVYIFSSFFYKRLTTKPAKLAKRSNPYEVDPNLTPAEKRHCRVKNWTKGVNIFEKDYIIIPINENSHWFLAIICYPGLEGCRSMIDSTKIIKVPTKEKKKVNTITIGNTTISALKDDKTKIADKPIKCDDEEVGSDRDEAEGDESELEDSENDSDPGEQIPEKKSNQREPIKQPCILIFDSLAGASRSRVVATLRDYLTCEHRTKLSSTKTFNKDNIKGACPKVPQQMNFTDCGLYVLQYVESFFKDPITDYHIPIKMLKNWFEEIVVTRKREDISNLIKELMVDNKKDPSGLPDIQFPTLNGELVGNMDGHYEEGEADMEEEIEEEEEDSSHCAEKLENSLTQISTMYNSDSSSESPVKTTETNVGLSATSTFVVSNVNSGANKPDLSDTKNKSNRDTMSYLKSKRIIRHRNQETNDNKKQKIE